MGGGSIIPGMDDLITQLISSTQNPMCVSTGVGGVGEEKGDLDSR